MAYPQPFNMRGGYLEPASYHTWNLTKVVYFSVAVFLMIAGIQDFLDPGRRKIPSVQLKALTSIALGFFLLYLFFTVINTPKYGR
jgi:hypothetical protein